MLLDLRSRRFLLFYRMLCLCIDTIALLFTLTQALLAACYRFWIPKQPKSLKGEIALVTGSGHGIGMELCVSLGKLGAILICLDKDREGNKKTAKMLKELGCEHHIFYCDVTNTDDLTRVVDTVLKEIGVPTLIINNAAVTKRKEFLDHSQEELEHMFLTNVIAPMQITKMFLPHMLNKPKTRHQIVSISSIVGMLGTPHMVPYSSTKFALTGFMEGMHYELINDKVTNIVLSTVHPFLVASTVEYKAKPNLRYQGLIGVLNVKDAVQKILVGIRREETEIYIPNSLFFITRLLRILPRRAQRRLLEFVEFGSGP